MMLATKILLIISFSLLGLAAIVFLFKAIRQMRENKRLNIGEVENEED